jgi:hypothetical protein
MSRIKLGAGTAFVELESDDDLATLEQRALSLLAALPGAVTVAKNERAELTPSERGGERREESRVAGGFDESINTVVARLKAESCREILRAAAVHITLADRTPVFSKADWLARAHSATEWKRGYGNMQATDIKRMIAADEIREKAGGQFAISAKYLEQTKAALNGE